MEVRKDNQGHVLLDIDLKEGTRLADEIIEHTGKLDLHTAMLDLSSLLRQAKFEAEDEFRQPPPDAEAPPSV